MERVATSSKREGPIMTDSGGTTRCKERVKLFSGKDSLSIPDSGSLTNTTAGEHSIPILTLISTGFRTKGSLKTG